jgi:hypothetical protein
MYTLGGLRLPADSEGQLVATFAGDDFRRSINLQVEALCGVRYGAPRRIGHKWHSPRPVKTATAGAPSFTDAAEDLIVFLISFLASSLLKLGTWLLFLYFLESLLYFIPTALIFNGIQALHGLSTFKKKKH